MMEIREIRVPASIAGAADLSSAAFSSAAGASDGDSVAGEEAGGAGGE